MNTSPEPKWVKEFRDYLINELHISKSDSIFIIGKLYTIKHKILV